MMTSSLLFLDPIVDGVSLLVGLGLFANKQRKIQNMLKVIFGALLLAAAANAAATKPKEASSVSAEEAEIEKVASIESVKEVVAKEEEIEQDEAQDRFVDLSVDVSYGLPQLGYVYNGLHLRGPRKAKQDFANYVHTGAQGRQTFQTNFDFDTDFEEIKEHFKRDPASSNIQVVVEETGDFVTPPVASTNFDFENEIPHGGAPPTTFATSPFSDNPNKYNFPPYVPPPTAGGVTPETAQLGATKPPLHIKIQKDLQGLVGSMKNMLKGQVSKEHNTAPFAFNLPSIPQPAGKPPLLEKMKQDFLFWLPTSKDESSAYGAPPATYQEPSSYGAPPASYQEPSYYHPPQSGYTSPKQEVREPMLNKMIKDIGKVNKWLANQVSGADFPAFELPSLPDLPELPELPRLTKRKDTVMKYIAAPDLSSQEGSETLQ